MKKLTGLMMVFALVAMVNNAEACKWRRGGSYSSSYSYSVPTVTYYYSTPSYGYSSYGYSYPSSSSYYNYSTPSYSSGYDSGSYYSSPSASPAPRNTTPATLSPRRGPINQTPVTGSSRRPLNQTPRSIR